ncbi:2-oxo-4-hydroxy-4-carboxy-5-ureidoimidazoline decarboxylase [Granulicella arctica]|uniref:2-oxo-4-hydroxy-4-carboxy-5-ureidoimidazoline decarboxylase n=1 Tax=Granulicella arctica TaxID=940613 RepID=UPI0021DFD570|nr:2-oxo-4-hydroxy-4-carboxy-5-ureidoimidazoline decarboxylase [Granulicella arctica]
MSEVLERWNLLDVATAAREVLPCCGSSLWAEELASRRPIATDAVLFAASDKVWKALPEAAWQEAFDSHPRIGQRQVEKQATAESLRWSEQEQQAAMSPDEAAVVALAEGNARYEAKFGRIFIVCASGRSAADILGILEGRMGNDPMTELYEAAEHQRQITQLRLRRWLEGR